MNSETNSEITLYQNHGNVIGYWRGWVTPEGMVNIEYAKSLDGKPVLKQYQAQPKNNGKSNQTTAFQQGVLELNSKARLKMDKGYVLTLAEAQAPSTNTLGLTKPMLATPMEKVKPEKIDWKNAFAQPKLDGHRALFKNGVLYSRQGKELDLPHIVQAIEQMGLMDLYLDGELYLHGYTLQELSKLIKKHRPETLDLQYHIYDQVMPNQFRERIADLIIRLGDIPYDHPNIKPVHTVWVESLDELMERHSEYRAEGYEGTMLRFGNDHYQDGKRSRSLLKLKEFHDDEFEIVNVEEGKPYINDEGTFQVPVWVCRTNDGQFFRVTAQGCMHTKHALWLTRYDYLGELLTVKYHYLSADGIPQLPVALRFRDDV